MHVGFTSMNTHVDPPPGELAVALEQRGFESLWYGEHSHIPCSRKTPYPAGGELPEPYKQMMDPYISLMAAAAATTTLRVGTGIALVMEREIFSQAKTIATLDRLSAGRVCIGVGVGWLEEEFVNVNRNPFNKRFGVLRETVAATRALWSSDPAEFHGDYLDFDPVWPGPGPLQQPGPPIYLGAMGPLGRKHAAAWADGWLPVDVGMLDIEADLLSFKQLVEDAGRDPASVPITLQVMDNTNLDNLKYYQDMGFERVNVGVSMDMWDKPEEVMPMIDRVAQLIPALKD